VASPIDITGNWKGRYFYPSSYSAPVPKEGVPFHLVLKKGWFGRFSGPVQDDPACGVPEPGWVRGRVKAAELWFVKQLPVLRFQSSEGKSETEQELLARHGIQHGPSRRHPPIFYQGLIAADNQRAEGEWILKARSLILGGRFFSMPESRGAWMMERE